MKRALTIALATLLAVCGMVSASAAVQPQKSKRVVYVASQPVPKAATEFARDWFSNRMPVQDICDQTKLTVEQAKKVRLCRAFRVESFEREPTRFYHFPLIYEDTFVGTLLVRWSSWDGGAGYTCQMGGGDDFLEPLNTLSSNASAPLMFIYTNDSCYVMDSANKVKRLRSYPPYSETVIERQMREMPKMQRPFKVVALGADTAYPEPVSSQQLADEEPVLTVKNETKKLKYISEDGGKTWKNNAKPPVYISIEKTYYPQKDGGIPYTLHNNTQNEMWTDVYFSLQKWNGQKWVSCPETDSMEFIDIALLVNPKGSTQLKASWGGSGISLEAGRYKLVKKIGVDNQQFTCETVFCLE